MTNEIIYYTEEETTQALYAEEIRKFINLYIDALCENDTEKAQYYFGLIKRY